MPTGSFTVTSGNGVNISGSGQITCAGDSNFNANASIGLDGTDAYIQWSDEDGWGDLGGLLNSGEDYSFGFVMGDAWQGGSFEPFSMFSRNGVNDIGLEDTTSINVQGLSWTGYSGSASSGSNGFDNDKADSFQAGDAIQFNFDASSYNCDVYYNGTQAESGGINMASWATKPQTSGVVRFGFPVTRSSGTGSYWDGKIKALWFAKGTRFSDGTISSDQNTNPDITGKSYYSDITSFFNLGNDTYPNVVDLKGNVSNGTLTNGVSGDFHTS